LTGGIPEIIGENGALVQSNNADALADAMLKSYEKNNARIKCIR